ncbi:MAG: hypothetical protein Fur0037_01960 [Planctomycetota bacterium]
MDKTPIAAAALLSLLAPSAKADRFWLRPMAEAERAVEGSRPDALEGVLLDRENGLYHLRVFGGEIWIPIAMVARVETDGLTLLDIERSEAEAAPRLAQAEKEREDEQCAALGEPAAVEASSDRGAAPSEASFDLRKREAESAPGEPAGFDPVRGVYVGAMPDQDLLRDMELAYRLTHDRRYLKALRMLRRRR